MANLWPPTRFWQYWALSGMVVLTAAGLVLYLLILGAFLWMKVAVGRHWVGRHGSHHGSGRSAGGPWQQRRGC